MDERYSGFRTHLIPDFNSTTMEVFDFNKKQFVKEDNIDNVLEKTLFDCISCIDYISSKHVNTIGKEKDEDISVYNRQLTETDTAIKKETNKIKKILCTNYENVKRTKEQYEKQQKDKLLIKKKKKTVEKREQIEDEDI